MKTAAATVLAVLLFSGCDPVRRIDMRNDTADTVTFVWHLPEDSLLFNPFFLYQSKDLTFRLAPQSKPVKLSFGPGNWSPGEVYKLVRHLESLEITSDAQRFKIDSLPLLRDFLLARRKGLGGARIEIAVGSLKER